MLIILLGSYAKGNYNDDIAVVFKDYSNIIDMQLELMRLRRKIDSRIEPHSFRENESVQIQSLMKSSNYRQKIKLNAAWSIVNDPEFEYHLNNSWFVIENS